MQFIVLGYDGSDAKAPERRLAAREAHIERGKKLYDRGRWFFAAGILDDEGKMIGSLIVCDFPSRRALETEWLNDEPYVTGKVWDRIEIHRAHVAPFISVRNSVRDQ